MRQYRFLQYDVFTGTPFSGNQLAVVVDATGLSDAEMQSIAREMNYSETTFVLPATDIKAVRKVRIFTPNTELPFAGHPTVGTTFALVHEKIIRAGDSLPIYLELGIGTLPIDLLFEGEQPSFVWMHQPTPTFTAWEGNREALAAALHLAPEDLADELPIEWGSAGVPFLYIPVRSLAALGQVQPEATALARVGNATQANAGFYVFTDILSNANGAIAKRSRMFAPGMGVAEDAATGSAAGPFGVYLLRHGKLAPDQHSDARLLIEQGVEMGRTSRLTVSLTCEGQAVQDVRVGGESVLMAEGTLLLP